MRAVASILLLVVAACSSDDDDAADTTPATTFAVTSAPSTAASAATSTPVAADDRAQAALDDVIAWLADPATLDAGRFSDAFLAQVPVEQLRPALVSVEPGQWRAVDVQVSSPSALAARLEGPGAPLLVELSVDAAGRIDGLLLRPAELADPPADQSALVTQLRGAPVAGYLRADVAPDGTCIPVAKLQPAALLPIGSAFKLYVLGALAAEIEAGNVSWAQPVEIRDELDSLPSGTTQDEPAGSTLTVEELALRMISASDNTATDHLIDLVGRNRVEQAFSELGHSALGYTIPMPTTRELFVIKTDPDLLARYESARTDERRALLAGEVAGAPLPAIEDFPRVPTAVTTVEWFASPADLCRALVVLDDLASRPGLEPLGEVLSANPGADLGDAGFRRVLFKGGSEPGVLFAAWLATRPDGSRIVVAGGVVDESGPVTPLALDLLALGLTLP